jgi:hypothetical protein
LTEVEWLDLSFNQIEVIEGLDKLTKLTDLALYSNNIKTLSGLDHLANLNVLSVGRNQIEEHETAIRYLSHLSNKLEVLKMADNKFPAHAKDDYEMFAIAFLKNLKYLDYELIEEDKRIAANEKYKDQQTDKQKEADKESKVEVDPDLLAAHCDSTIGIFKNVIDDDEEMKKLRLIPDTFQEPFTSHETDVIEDSEKF